LTSSVPGGDKQLRVNRQGGKYILLKLADRPGTIAAMMWNVDESVSILFDRGDYVFVHGRTQVHNGCVAGHCNGRSTDGTPAKFNCEDF